MAYRELLDYVRKTREQGFSDEQIIEALRKRGWTRQDVQECFSILAGQEKFKPLPPDESKTRDEKLEELKQAEERAEFIARGYSIFEGWFSSISRPKEALAKAKYFASYGKALTAILTPFILAAIAVGSGILLFPQRIAQQLPENVYALLLGMGTTLFVGATIGGIALSVLQYVTVTAIVWLAAKMLGGRAPFKQHFFLSSIAFGATFILSLAGAVLLLVLNFLPSGGVPPLYAQGYPVPVFVVVGLALFFLLLAYGFWLHLIAVRTAHEFGSLKAFAAVLLGCLAFSVMLALIGFLSGAVERLSSINLRAPAQTPTSTPSPTLA